MAHIVAEPCAVCLDSGSDHCLFPMSLVPSLGFDPLDMPSQPISGLGNSGNIAYFESVEIDLGNGVHFRTLAGFTKALDGGRMGLLGQVGFFENFRVTFDYTSRRFHIDTGRDPV